MAAAQPAGPEPMITTCSVPSVTADLLLHERKSRSANDTGAVKGSQLMEFPPIDCIRSCIATGLNRDNGSTGSKIDWTGANKKGVPINTVGRNAF